MKINKQAYVVISSVIMMLLMGTVYSYSVFRYHIEERFALRTLQSGLPYMVSLFFYALSMMVSGRLLKPNRLRLFVFIGTLLIASGWLLSSLMTSFILLILSYGVLIGIGVGMVYGVPIYMMQKLFPKRSGLMAGIVLLGFGMSPLITAPFASFWIQRFGLSQTFLIFGLISIGLQLPLSMLFVLKEPEEHLITSVHHTNFVEDKKPFKSIYFMFVIATTIGLMMIGLSYQIGVSYYGFGVEEVTLSLSMFAIANGVARPIFGRLMDKKGFKTSVFTSLSLLTVASLIGIFNQGQDLTLYVISFAIYWFNLGAWLAIVPATIKEFYGIKNYAKKYGVMFTAYGLGSIVGTLISGTIMDVLGWTTMLYGFVLLLIFVSFGFLFFKKNLSFTKLQNEQT